LFLLQAATSVHLWQWLKICQSWVLGKSDSGWMKVNVFYEYIANDFNNWMIENSIKKTGHPFHRWTQVTYDFAIKRILRKE
jgi:hypothetical protein